MEDFTVEELDGGEKVVRVLVLLERVQHSPAHHLSIDKDEMLVSSRWHGGKHEYQKQQSKIYMG